MIEFPYAVEIRAMKMVDGEMLTVSHVVNTELLDDQPPGWGKSILEYFERGFEKAIRERAKGKTAGEL